MDAGSLDMKLTTDKGDFVQTRYHDAFLAEMVQSHLIKDFCVVGSRVCMSEALNFILVKVRWITIIFQRETTFADRN